MATGFWDDFKRFFFRGLAAVLPTVLTLAVIVWVFSSIQRYFGNYINWGAAEAVTRFWVWRSGVDDVAHIRGMVFTFWGKYLFWFGFFLAIVGIYIFGRLLASFLGRATWRLIERTIIQLPIIKQIYPSIKQVTDFLLAERKMEVSKVVAVEYPRKGIWSLGLVTSRGMRTLDEALEGKLLTVFIPSSPTPVTGYTITVRQEDVIDLPLSLDEALRFTVSAGVIQPTAQRTGEIRLGQNKPQLFAEVDEKEKC